MRIYIIRRLLYVIPVMLMVSIIVFGILQIAPGDPASTLAGLDASQEDIEMIKQKFGLDQPIYMQYGIWLWNILKADFGRSIVTRRPVLKEIATRIKPTFELASASLFFATIAGIMIGVISSTRQYSFIDHFSMILALLGVSTPIFWLGLMLIFIFSVGLQWFPTGGAGTLHHLFLPAITLGAASTAIIARMTRSCMLDVVHQDYIRTARAKGLKERIVIIRHALKNALIPVVTVIGLQYGYLLGGAVIVETVFSRPGLGRILVDSIKSRDFPLVQATIMLLAASFVIVNLIVDIIYAYIDPRIRYEK